MIYDLRIPKEWECLFEFTVSGVPQPMAKKLVGRYGQLYPADPTGKKTGWLEEVRRIAVNWKSKKVKGRFPIIAADVPLYVVVAYYLPRPKSAPKSRTCPTRKPDNTNLFYAVENALTGIVWTDDNQIVCHVIEKVYSENPRMELSVWTTAK